MVYRWFFVTCLSLFAGSLHCEHLPVDDRISRKEINMNDRFVFTIVCGLLACSGCQPVTEPVVSTRTEIAPVSDGITIGVVEAACGQCQFGMPGTGCDLAVRIEGHDHFVDGTSIDGHGDAHAEKGLCNFIRTARVSGELVDGRFIVSSFELLAESTEPLRPDKD